MHDTRDVFAALLAAAGASDLDRSDRLARGAMLLGRVVDPDLDVEAGLGALDDLGREPTIGVAARRGPSDLALALFGSGRLRGNAADYYDPQNSLLTSVLERGLGIPITLSVIFIDVAGRHGLRVEGVSMPGHFLTKSGDRYFDPFHAGAELDESGCQQLYHRLAGRPAQLPAGALAQVPAAAIWQRMLWNLRSIAEGRGDSAMLVRTLALLSVFPDSPLPVKLAWARSLAESGRFDQAAEIAEEAATSQTAQTSARLLAMADRWRARLN